MCTGDDKNCPEFELHHRKPKEADIVDSIPPMLCAMRSARCANF